eukprot:m.185225 g.185225  ORF g.185225 m.185225 type:complete len:465 (+) comp21569_c0_seq5:785-2179(+)
MAKRTAEAEQLAGLLKNAHATLRDGFAEAKAAGSTDLEIWDRHVNDESTRQTYAATMKELATKHWEDPAADPSHSRIQWTLTTLEDYFRRGGLVSALKKDWRRHQHTLHAALPANHQETAADLFNKCAFAEERKVTVLDVGSCYNPFARFPGLEVTAIDLSPASPSVQQCDFIHLEVTPLSDEDGCENKLQRDDHFMNDDASAQSQLPPQQHPPQSQPPQPPQQQQNLDPQQPDVVASAASAAPAPSFSSTRKRGTSEEGDAQRDKIGRNAHSHDAGAALTAASPAPGLAAAPAQDSAGDDRPAAPTETIGNHSEAPSVAPALGQARQDATRVFVPRESSFDAVVFCLLLTYIPSPALRFRCCENARRVLKHNGLLVIVSPDSSHVGKGVPWMKEWKAVIERIGFRRVKYSKLPNLHCMAFRAVFNDVDQGLSPLDPLPDGTQPGELTIPHDKRAKKVSGQRLV